MKKSIRNLFYIIILSISFTTVPSMYSYASEINDTAEAEDVYNSTEDTSKSENDLTSDSSSQDVSSVANIYNENDLSVINTIIRNNNLTGYIEDEPQSWDFAVWSEDISDKRIIGLYLTAKQLTGILDVSSLSELEFLQCTANDLSGININGLLHLTDLACDRNSLNSLDLSGVPNLKKLGCHSNNLSSLDSFPPGLTTLNCGINPLTSLDTRSLSQLSIFYCPELPLKQFTSPDGILCTINSATGGYVITGWALEGDPSLYNHGYQLSTKEFTVSAYPDTGYTFSHWEITPAPTFSAGFDADDATTTFILDKNTTITPVFSSTSDKITDAANVESPSSTNLETKGSNAGTKDTASQDTRETDVLKQTGNSDKLSTSNTESEENTSVSTNTDEKSTVEFWIGICILVTFAVFCIVIYILKRKR